MEKPIKSFSMDRNGKLLHGNFDNQKYHGRIAGNAPWKNSKSRFPWPEFPKLPMEFLKIRISMVASGNTVQKRPRNAPLYGRNKKIRGKYASKWSRNAPLYGQNQKARIKNGQRLFTAPGRNAKSRNRFPAAKYRLRSRTGSGRVRSRSLFPPGETDACPARRSGRLGSPGSCRRPRWWKGGAR